MSTFLQRRYQHNLLVAGRMYNRGRTRVLWQYGVLYFGGSLFLLFNAIAYFVDPAPPRGSKEWLWILVWLLVCVAAGYIRGILTWRNLARACEGIRDAR